MNIYSFTFNSSSLFAQKKYYYSFEKSLILDGDKEKILNSILIINFIEFL